MVRAAGYAYVALAWALVAAIVLQVFFIGLGLFGSPEYREVHVNFGWLLHLAPLIVLVAAAAAGAGRGSILLAAGMAVIIWFVPILAVLRGGAPIVAAFHPVIALLSFWLAYVVARRATDLTGQTDTRATPLREWAVVAVVVVVFLFLSFSGSPEPA